MSNESNDCLYGDCERVKIKSQEYTQLGVGVYHKQVFMYTTVYVLSRIGGGGGGLGLNTPMCT